MTGLSPYRHERNRNRHQHPTNVRQPKAVRPGYFVWLVLPILLIGGYLAFGLPHVIWSYDWRPLGPNSYSDFSQRHYTRCSYLGPYGLVTEYPRDGRCGWVRFVKAPEGRI